MSKKLPTWLKNSSEELKKEIDPENIIIGCPFGHDLKVNLEHPKKLTSEEINNLINNNDKPKTYDTKKSLIDNFNAEKELRHNIYFNMFNDICNTVYPIYENKLKSINVIKIDFFDLIIKEEPKLLITTLLNEIDLQFKLNTDKNKSISENMENFKSLQNSGHRKLGNNRGDDNLYTSSILGFDMFINSMWLYFFHIVNNSMFYQVWVNKKKLKIPKHFYYGASVSQAHSYLINNMVLRKIVSQNPQEILYDEFSQTGYSHKIEKMLQERIKDFSYNDFYHDISGGQDLSNLIMPLEKNYPCPAIGFFPQMRGICLGIMIEKYGKDEYFL